MMYELDEEGKSELSDCGGRKKRKDLTWSFVRKRNDEMMFLAWIAARCRGTTRNYLRIVRLKFGENSSDGST